ncbi:23S rRNA (pseudouridine(1915)-N(3))-methyltransferase RlmH [Parvimonas micra]
MNIKILCVGKLSEKFFKDACDEYKKRISAFSKIEIIEIPEEKILTQTPSKLEIENVLKKEEGRILNKISDSDFVITLEILGKSVNSEDFSKFLEEKMNDGNSKFILVIGGSFGLGDEIKKRSNFKLSFSKFTLPHQLFRVVLLEQIYRAFKIMNNQIYHK